MPELSATQIEVLTLPGIDAPRVKPPVKLSSRNAFARVPFPGYWGVDETKFQDVSQSDEALVAPDAILPHLYDEDSKHAIRGVVFTPQEFSTIPLSVKAFSRRVGARALGAQVPLVGEVAEEVSVDKRAASHAFESTIPKLAKLNRGYTDTIAKMRWLKKEIPKHWLAHTSEGDMRMRVTTARMGFEAIIDSVAASEEWDKDKLQAAHLAHEKRLLTGKLEDKKTEWTGWVALSGNLALSKRGIVSNKISEMQRYINPTA